MNNYFSTFVQSNSAFDANPTYRVSNGSTVADVRRQFGEALGLSGDHRAYVRGNAVNDDFTPAAGDDLVWKESAKDRG